MNLAGLTDARDALAQIATLVGMPAGSSADDLVAAVRAAVLAQARIEALGLASGDGLLVMPLRAYEERLRGAFDSASSGEAEWRGWARKLANVAGVSDAELRAEIGRLVRGAS